MPEGEAKMAKWKKAAHVVYQCSYHLVWTPKYRYRILQGDIKEYVDKKIRAICEWKRVEILEMTIMPDHVHLVAIIPPKLAIAEFMGIVKGKTAIAVFQHTLIEKVFAENLSLMASSGFFTISRRYYCQN
jgi:putative transposase